MRPKHSSGRKSERYVASFPRVVHSRHDANRPRSARRVVAVAVCGCASLMPGFAGPTTGRPALGLAVGGPDGDDRDVAIATKASDMSAAPIALALYEPD